MKNGNASNALKKPFVSTINEFATHRISSAIQLLGKALPATVTSVDGQIVTVKFDATSTFTLPEVTVPVSTSLYRMEPIQIGDRGIVRPADVPLGAVSGLGAATVALDTDVANLEALVWEPVANANWSPSPNPDAYLIQGPDGFILRDIGDNCSIVGDKEKVAITGKTTVLLQVGGNEILIDSSGVHITGTLFINGQQYSLHTHSNVQSGTSNSGPVT